MLVTGKKLVVAIETYFADLSNIRASGGGTDERVLLSSAEQSAEGRQVRSLQPKVFCVGELAEQGAGHPDFGLYAAKQVQRRRPRKGQVPECGVVEVKPVGDDAWLTAESDQVSKYWDRYRLVLVTNTRDFVLVGEDIAGNPETLETFRLADTVEEFEARLQKPRVFAREAGTGFRRVPVQGAVPPGKHRGASGPGVASGLLCQGRAGTR